MTMHAQRHETRWLDADQQRVWRAWLQLSARLPMATGRQLADHALSNADYEVLVGLTDQPDGRRRVSELSGAMAWERSRISHHVKRMAARGLVERVDCDSDGRGAFVAITPAGRAAIEGAAPGHVELVRELLFDQLTDDELTALDSITRKVLDRLANGPCREAIAAQGVEDCDQTD
jgi:DNA-binding MarR family transcriptional regulator